MVVLDGRGQQPEGREHSRGLGHDHLGHPHLLGQGHPVHRARASQHHQGELARIVAALDRHEADLVGHPRIDHAMNPRGRRDGLEPELAGHGAYCALGGGPVECHEPVREALRVQVT